MLVCAQASPTGIVFTKLYPYKHNRFLYLEELGDSSSCFRVEFLNRFSSSWIFPSKKEVLVFNK